ncbi:hypothetical protein NA78x_001727 [Anatilimnocola sp. NA78]|uniref:hypothetical protein n=1 Tax=Anatilimnocola sp. NA78 TaxID=3415683 RepID=UPI003CE4ADA3
MSILDEMFQTYAMPTLQHWFGVTVKLNRKGRETPNVKATWWRPPEEVDLEGMPTKVTHRVFRIARDAYVIDEAVVEPKRSDFIIETINGQVFTFEVLPNDDLPAFELDGDGYHWILRTKKV